MRKASPYNSGHISLLLATLSILITNCDAGQLCSSCSDISKPMSCNRHIMCRDDEQCLHRQYANRSGDVLYELGCISSQSCEKSPILVGKRLEGPHFKCFSCCNETALCNQLSDCGQTTPSQNGRVCASCSRVTSPEDCHHQETCAPDERCYAYRVSTSTGQVFYDVGCMSESVCLSSPNPLSSAKRSEDHHIKCIACCSEGNMCNRNLTCGESVVPSANLPRDCGELDKRFNNQNGSYTIYPYGVANKSVNVYCEFDIDGVWTIIQRRYNGSVNFYRNWTEYKQGFGSSNGEYWLGNDFIHQLTTHGNYTLKIVLTDWNDTMKYAEYNLFRVRGEVDNYRLTIGGYFGDAGDSMAYHNGGQFSTWDRDNDVALWDNDCVRNCGRGAWWHTHCCHSSLNAVYTLNPFSGSIKWYHWHGHVYSLKATKMMIKKK